MGPAKGDAADQTELDSRASDICETTRVAEEIQRVEQLKRLDQKALDRKEELVKGQEEKTQEAAEQRLTQAGFYRKRLTQEIHDDVVETPDAHMK